MIRPAAAAMGCRMPADLGLRCTSRGDGRLESGPDELLIASHFRLTRGICAGRDGPGTPGELDRKTGLDMALRVGGADPACHGPVPGSAIVDVVEVACGSETGPAFWRGGVPPPAAREPAAVRGDPRPRVRGRPADRGRRPGRLRALRAWLAGPPLAGRGGRGVLPGPGGQAPERRRGQNM